VKNYFGIKTTVLLAVCGLVSCTTGQQASESNAKVAAASHVAASTINKFEAYTQKFTEDTRITQNHATGHVGDFFFTHWKDGGSASLSMSTDGAYSVSWAGGGYNYVGGPGWHFGDVNRVIGYHFNEDSGANFVTVYGWGYDQNMPASNPAHLVEYYILQRWTYDPSQHATFGKTFTSNGVEYSTYRSIREDKPSINGSTTFYQYWSKPAETAATVCAVLLVQPRTPSRSSDDRRQGTLRRHRQDPARRPLGHAVAARCPNHQLGQHPGRGSLPERD
jgi:endo-1,4-beta-xylanase